jgi:hypothetical protein
MGLEHLGNSGSVGASRGSQKFGPNQEVNGHFRNRFFGGTYHIVQAYCSGLCLREYPPRIFSDPEIPSSWVNLQVSQKPESGEGEPHHSSDVTT